MPNSPSMPTVEVAANAIFRPGLVLTVYNPRWGAFTLPMTKRRRWKDPTLRTGVRTERWRDAAIREAADLLGRTLVLSEFPTLLMRTEEYQQSDRSGEWKSYDFRVFRMQLQPNERLRDGVIAEWVCPEDAMEGKVRPVSPTTVYILLQLKRKGLLGA